jgi:hypothetical protein
VAFADAAMVRAGKAEDQLEEQMNVSIRMEPEESSPARTPGGLSFFCHALLLYPNQIESDRAPGFITSREFGLTTVSADKFLSLPAVSQRRRTSRKRKKRMG